MERDTRVRPLRGALVVRMQSMQKRVLNHVAVIVALGRVHVTNARYAQTPMKCELVQIQKDSPEHILPLFRSSEARQMLNKDRKHFNNHFHELVTLKEV